ncbi:MAG: hypothetical protein R2883_08230 [Caldisericia bacterium]
MEVIWPSYNKDSNKSVIHRLDIEDMGEITWKSDELKGEAVINLCDCKWQRSIALTYVEDVGYMVYNFEIAPLEGIRYN